MKALPQVRMNGETFFVDGRLRQIRVLRRGSIEFFDFETESELTAFLMQAYTALGKPKDFFFSGW